MGFDSYDFSKKTENCCYYGFKFHHADFTFVAKFPNLEWILCRRGFGKYSHTADGMLGKVK